MYGKVIFLGRLTKEPELSKTNTGKSVLSFDIAVNSNYNKEISYFHKMVAWGNNAEYIANYANKGSLIFIEGEPQVRTYEKDGNKVWVTEYNVNTAKLIGNQSNGQSNGQSQNSSQGYEQQPNGEPLLEIDSDFLPF